MSREFAPYKILQVVPSLDTGGAERTTIDIAKALAQRGCGALVASEGGRLEPELQSAGGELVWLPVASKNPAVIWKNAAALTALIRKRSISLVHARSRAPAWSAFLAARRMQVPFVTTYHGIYNENGALKRIYNSVMAKGDAVIANSGWTADHVRHTYPSAADRIVVIPRGIDLARFDPAVVDPERVQFLRRAWRIREDERIVLLPGRLTRWKGQLVFLRALSLMKERNRLPRNLRAVIAGDAQGRVEYRNEILAAITQANLTGIVMLSEHVRDMPAAYLAADIVVSASTDPEAFGRVAPEAAAMGRPVVATDHGGARETVLSGESGMLVPPDDASALAGALSVLLEKSIFECLAMGERGRAHIESRFTVERMCAETLALYDRLIRQHVKPPHAPSISASAS